MPHYQFTSPRVRKDFSIISGLKMPENAKGIDNKGQQTFNKLDRLDDLFNNLNGTINAGKLQDHLKKKGFEIEHDESVSPNGVTCTPDGFIITLKTQDSTQQRDELVSTLKGIGPIINDFVSKPTPPKREKIEWLPTNRI